MFTPSEIQGKNILLRADLDLPLQDGEVEDTFRLQSLLPTLSLCLAHARRTCVIGHLGRPEGPNPLFSLKPVLQSLKRLINQDIHFIPSGFSPGECWTGETPLALMENLRFDSREENISREFATQLSLGADLYIYEAFASYRPSTSLQIIPELLPTRTGLQFDKEIEALTRLLTNPEHPTLLIASGSKPDKLDIIRRISYRFDRVLLGGKFANPSLLTPDGLDLNQKGVSTFLEAVSQAKTMVLNGPLGRYEDGTHSLATKAVFQALARSRAYTLLGGGDTLAALSRLGFTHSDFSFVSTGGGAMLEFLDSGTHPLLQVLSKDR